MPFKDETVSVRDGMFSTHIRRGGAGEPLVFLHGAGGQNAIEPWMEALAQKYEIIVPEHPGWGQSTGIDHLDDVNLAGGSLGGMFAAEIAALSPSYVRKLVLVDPAGLWIDESPMADFFIMTPQELGAAIWADP